MELSPPAFTSSSSSSESPVPSSTGMWMHMPLIGNASWVSFVVLITLDLLSASCKLSSTTACQELAVYLISRFQTIGMEKNRPAPLILIHQAWILKMWYQRGPSLDSSISQGGYFLTVELLPFLPIKCLQIKGKISFKIHSTGNLDSLSYTWNNILTLVLTFINRGEGPRNKAHLIEWYNVCWWYHVNECISNIAFVLHRHNIK